MHGPNKNSEPTGPPERTFRVVLAGDASVGKSSLIMRLVKDKFVGNLQSTLGVDFQVKTLNVDGKNVAIQLWDTAGQERFRSLCKSYFRRADGAILVFDCTSEQSFLNVRNWMETIQESVQKKIPVLMCCNKIDLRISAASDGKRIVAEEDGRKLAKLFSAIYIETSAKEGTNVKPAALEMARELLAYEDCEVRSTSVILSNVPGKKVSPADQYTSGFEFLSHAAIITLKLLEKLIYPKIDPVDFFLSGINADLKKVDKRLKYDILMRIDSHDTHRLLMAKRSATILADSDGPLTVMFFQSY